MTKKMISLPVPSVPVTRFNPPTLFQASSAAPTLAGVPSVFAMHELLPHNQKLVDFIRQHQPISIARLFEVYPDVGEASFLDFGKRVTYLAGKHWLIRAGKGPDSVLTFNAARIPARKAVRPAAAPKPTPTPYIGHLVAPRRINMLAGTYQPTAPQAQRPGSEDHLRLPSLRQGARVPHVPGYIFY